MSSLWGYNSNPMPKAGPVALSFYLLWEARLPRLRIGSTFHVPCSMFHIYRGYIASNVLYDNGNISMAIRFGFCFCLCLCLCLFLFFRFCFCTFSLLFRLRSSFPFSVNLSFLSFLSISCRFLVAAVRHSFGTFEQLYLFHVLTIVDRASSTSAAGREEALRPGFGSCIELISNYRYSMLWSVRCGLKRAPKLYLTN